MNSSGRLSIFLSLQLPNCVTLSKLPDLSSSQFFICKTGIILSISRNANCELMYVKFPVLSIIVIGSIATIY